MKEFDFVAIGDIVTDAFIRLKDPEAHTEIDHGMRELCVEFGAKIPYESVTVVPAVGNCANAAVAAARLGLSTALISNQGDDEIGRKQLEVLEKENVARDFVKSHVGMKTNYHYVLWYHDERTILVKHEEYPYEMPASPAGSPAGEAGTSEVGNPKWLYLTSLGPSSLAFHHEIEHWLKSHPETKLAFQPGTFQINLGYEKLKYFYERAELFFCNAEEAEKILNDPNATEGHSASTWTRSVQALGPKIAVVTDGPKGAYATDGNNSWFIPPYPDPKPPYERTGAGDAFASTITSALALGLPLEEALLWGPVNSMSVVQKVGAREGLLTKDELQNYLRNSPALIRQDK